MGLSFADSTMGASKYDPSSPTDVIEALFKEWYLPGVRDQLNNKRVLSRIFSRNASHVMTDGHRAFMSLNTSRNESSISVREFGKLPSPQKQGYMQATYEYKNNYSTIMVTGQSVSSSRTNRGSFIRILESEMQGCIRDRGIEDNRILWGDGGGALAQVLSQNGGLVKVAVFDNPGGFVNPGPGVLYVRPGQILGFVNAGAGTLYAAAGGNTGFRVARGGVNGATGAVTFEEDLPLAMAVGSKVVKLPEVDIGTTAAELIRDTSYDNEAFGLAAIIGEANPSTRLLGDIDATIESIWQSPVVHNSGAPIAFTQGMFDQGRDALDIVGDGTVGLWMTSHGIRRQYLHDLISNKRYSGVAQSADGSFTTLAHNGVPIVVDRDATRGRIYGIDETSLYMFENSDYVWMDGDNSVLLRDPSRDAYKATLAKYYECGTDKRNANVLIRDIMDN